MYADADVSSQQVGKNPTIEEEPLQPPFPKSAVEADAKHLAEQQKLGSFGDQLKAFDAAGNGACICLMMEPEMCPSSLHWACMSVMA